MPANQINLNQSTNNNLKNSDNLIWLDMEMTGLDHNTDVILEIAIVITDAKLNILTESISYPIWQSDDTLNQMDKWNTNTHTKSGLVERVKSSEYNTEKVEKELIQLLSKYTFKGRSPMCGNTIHQDRKFLSKYMPKLEEHFHYRNLDVSTIKEIAKRWYPEAHEGFKKHNKHEALADIHESIQELKYYQEKIFK